MQHERIAEVAEAELNPVRGTRRFQHGGFFDLAHSKPGEPTSRYPELVAAYHERQRKLGEVGEWRHKRGFDWKVDDGDTLDSPYFIIEW